MAHIHTSEGLILYGLGNIIILYDVATMSNHSFISNYLIVLFGILCLNIGILKNKQFYVDNYDEMNPRDIIRNA